MRKSFRFLGALLLIAIFPIAALAQSITISGNVRNSSNKDVVPAVSITIKGTSAGTFSDEKGNFKLVTTQKPPFTLVFTSVGYESQEVNVNSAADFVQVDFVPGSSLGVEVVVSASRVPERILESPVSIERIGIAQIRNSPAATYYDALFNIKGVDLTTSSLTFRTVGTRGFNGSGNVRLNQIVDGMDNQAPGLNFPVGSVIGLTELDVESMELLPGASSALYGPGGMNGTLLINSKSPFKYQGFSFQVKQGIMHTDKKQRSGAGAYYDWTFRWGKTIGDRFAFKIGGQLIQAKDWLAADSTNYLRVASSGNVKAGTRLTDPNYDGVNVYGDETSVDIRPFLQGAIAANPGAAAFLNQFLASPLLVSRTGYNERDVVNPNSVNIRLSGGLYYKLTNTIEASLVGFWGSGNTVYTGAERYNLKDLKMAQYKLELKHRNWFVRGYTTQENSGESYAVTSTSRIFNEGWKPSYNPANAAGSWYPQYTTAFVTTLGTVFQTVLGSGGTPAQAVAAANAAALQGHINGRALADVGRPLPGTSLFKTLFDQVRKTPIPNGGLFVDRSDLWVGEGQYNFTEHIKFVEFLVGASYKKYILNSNGTLFADKVGEPIDISEYGGYAQISKKLFKDVLKLTASGRYDKNENFKGRFTPRVTAVIQPKQNHNFRFSYQTAYRFPTTQQQWIDLLVSGGVRLLGGVPFFWNKYNMIQNPVFTLESVLAGTPEVFTPTEVKPESVQSFEAGYKSLIAKKLLIDVYGYWGQYENFLSRRVVLQGKAGPQDLPDPTKRNIYSVVVNTPGQVKTFGWGLGFEYLLPRSFSVTANISSDDLTDVPVGFQSGFNSPKTRMNVTVANSGFGDEKRLSAAITWRWQKGFAWESDFATGYVPDFYTLDAQISYKLPSRRSIFKLGANNILNRYYKTAFGNPTIGGLYYISFGYNVF